MPASSCFPIPAGTGAPQYRNIEMVLEKEFMDDEPSELLEEQLIDDNEEMEDSESTTVLPNFSLTE